MLAYENENVLVGKINVKDLMPVLRVSDVRSALNWCKKKRLLIIPIGKENYVQAIDYELAVDYPFIEALKRKHPAKWSDLYGAYKRGDLIAVAELKLTGFLPDKSKFKASGDAAKKFLKNLNPKNIKNGRD